MIFRLLILSIGLLMISQPAFSQRKHRQKDQQTPADAMDKEKANRDQAVANYQMKKEYHDSIQDKKTKRRMKKTYKRSQKQSWGKETPWIKRAFRRKKF